MLTEKEKSMALVDLRHAVKNMRTARDQLLEASRVLDASKKPRYYDRELNEGADWIDIPVMTARDVIHAVEDEETVR